MLPQIFKEISKFFKKFTDRKPKLRRIPASYGSLSSGSVFAFTYKGENVIALVVEISRTKSGVFRSTRGNLLVASYKLNEGVGVNDTVLISLLESFIGVKPIYSKSKSLFDSLLGSNKFRTYNVNYINDLYEVIL